MERNFSQRVKDVLGYSREEAGRLQNGHISPEHIFLGILREGSGPAIDVLRGMGIELNDIKVKIESLLRATSEHGIIEGNELVISKSTDKVIKMSVLEARLLKSEVTDTEHLLLAILKEADTPLTNLLGMNKIDYITVLKLIKRGSDSNINTSLSPLSPRMGAGFTDEDDEDLEEDKKYRNEQSKQQSVGYAKAGNDTPVIDNFGTDMTKAAEENRLDPVVGREKEIERLAQVLSRRKKNNPVLIGEPGVGKSAIVEGLALRIIQRKVSRVLFDKRVISLDMASIVAGTKYRGQFEERIKALLNELSKNPNIILFIDEIHTIVGAGGATGTLDAANMLKPALARGEIQCIGATTMNEYRKSIEKDGALERRFQKIIVDPTTPAETLQILKNIKERYEEHHNVTYTQEALEACVQLTDRYVSDRNFPDKAIDALDEAGSRVHISNIVVPKNIEDLEEQIEVIRKEKLMAVKSQNYELAASFRDKEKEHLLLLEQAKEEWKNQIQEQRETVDEEKIAEVVAMMTGVPVQRIAQAEGIRLLKMGDMLKKKVVGQNEAIEKIVKAIQRNRVGLKDPNKPIGTFMFLGPTGVGKTHLAKMLAEYLFDSKDTLIRMDMSEYMEKFTVSRLIGAPPGYVGYEEGGQLTEKVRRKPYSVVLLDEIEKAHPDVFNLLLQVMDEGRLTDSLGRRIDFKNTILIMTSNIGTRQLKDFGRGVGFTPAVGQSDKEFSRSVIHKALNRAFSPEFLNRIDDIVMFDQLDKDTITQIVDIELIGLYKRMEDLGYKLKVTEDAKTFVASKGYDVQFGARPLKRAIQQYFEDELSELIMKGELKADDTIVLDFDKSAEKVFGAIKVEQPKD